MGLNGQRVEKQNRMEARGEFGATKDRMEGISGVTQGKGLFRTTKAVRNDRQLRGRHCVQCLLSNVRYPTQGDRTQQGNRGNILRYPQEMLIGKGNKT